MANARAGPRRDKLRGIRRYKRSSRRSSRRSRRRTSGNFRKRVKQVLNSLIPLKVTEWNLDTFIPAVSDWGSLSTVHIMEPLGFENIGTNPTTGYTGDKIKLYELRIQFNLKIKRDFLVKWPARFRFVCLGSHSRITESSATAPPLANTGQITGWQPDDTWYQTGANGSFVSRFSEENPWTVIGDDKFSLDLTGANWTSATTTAPNDFIWVQKAFRYKFPKAWNIMIDKSNIGTAINGEAYEFVKGYICCALLLESQGTGIDVSPESDAQVFMAFPNVLMKWRSVG